MISIFKDFEVNREQVIAQNVMRTVLSAVSCTPASRGNDFDILEAKQVHKTSLLEQNFFALGQLLKIDQEKFQLWITIPSS